MNTTKPLCNYIIKSVFVLAFIFTICFILHGRANADALDYLNNNYNGTVTRDDGADMYTQPGSANPKLTKDDGTVVHLDAGTELLIFNEEYDADLDVWYKCRATVDGVVYEGYVYTGRVTRGDIVPFTPTPAPTNTPTPDVATGSISDPVIDDGNNDDASMNKDTQNMIDDSNGFKPWKWITILVIVILVFMIGYTIWVKTSEEKLEREIERYSNRPQYEPLEGELEEDFEEAKSLYYDHIGLGDQGGRSLGEVIGNPEDVQLDMTGIFDDDTPEVSPEETPVAETNYNSESYEEGDSLKSLIASLEEKLGSSSFDEEETEEATQAADLSEIVEDEEPEPATAPVDEVSETIQQEAPVVTETKVPEFVRKANAEQYGRRPVPVRETRTEKNFVNPELTEMFHEKEDDYQPSFDLRDMLDNLNEGDTIVHTVYGEGVVEDNSDAQIIQVRFGNDVRFLKKEKLVKKNLIEF
ncbi:MAG: hypothetical protein ACI39R_07020 [Lachnospiraceae bacterium]